MRKLPPLILLVVLITIGTAGCKNVQNNSSVPNELSQAVESSSSSNSSATLSSDSESVSVYEFSDKEIENAIKVAETYYKDTTWKPKSIEYDKASSVYKRFYIRLTKKNYELGKFIILTVTIEGSEDPPRGISLIKTNSDWEVEGEGY